MESDGQNFPTNFCRQILSENFVVRVPRPLRASEAAGSLGAFIFKYADIFYRNKYTKNCINKLSLKKKYFVFFK